MSRKRLVRLAVIALAAAAAAGMAAIAAQVPAQSARPGPAAPAASSAAARIAPSGLERGPRPAVAYLRRDTIHDGAVSVRGPSGRHSKLWQVARGYLVLNGGGRLTYVGRHGYQQLLGTRVYTVAVSPGLRRVAWGSYEDPSSGPPVLLTVADTVDGRSLGRRTFHQVRWAQAVERDRVVLATSFAAPAPATWWWHPGHARLHRIARQAAVGADLRHDRMVFSVGDPDGFCNRVARVSHPHATLWRSCRSIPHQWSPDGRHALATHTYFDDTGTDYWAVVGGATGQRVSRVTGRLDWNAVWEDRHHFLTSAMGRDGRAAVVRCDLRRHCERATRLWDTGWTGWPPFYVAPPVLLAQN